MATRTISVAGGNFNVVGTWDEGIVPVAGDAVVARAGGDSGDLTVNVASGGVGLASVDFTHYAHKLTMNNTLTIAGPLTLSPSAMTFAGTGDIICNTTATITFNTKQLTGGLQLKGTSQAYTLGDDWSMVGALTFGFTTALTFIGAHNITCRAITCTTGADFTINLSGNITGSGAFTHAGSVTFTGAFAVQCASMTLASNKTITIAHDCTCTGTMTTGVSPILNGAFNWYVGGLNLGTGNVSGSSSLIMTGGTWITSGQSVNIPLTLAGDIIVSGTVKIDTTTLTYSPTHTITTGGSILTVSGNCTLATSGVGWDGILLSGAQTLTLNSLLSANTLTLTNADTVFTGAAGWTVGALAGGTLTGVHTITLKEGLTYTITGSMALTQGATSTYIYTITSAHAVTKTILTLGYGATQANARCNATRVDSSLGQAIYAPGGTLTTCFNWTNIITSANVLGSGGESLAIAALTKTNSGGVLGSVDCYLFRDNGNNTPTYLQYIQSNAGTGAYSFTVYPGSTYFVVGFKNGVPNVMDVTDRTLVAV